ncbi:MAG: 50S ribosomal protein L3 [Anaerolineae bacterium]
MKGILGKKVGMTQIFDETGEVVPVTVIEAGPCYVTQVKTEETDGYNAIQIGFEHIEERKLKKPQRGHLGTLPPVRYLREIRTDDVDQYEVGQQVDAGIFETGQRVDVTGTSKGRGFAGVVKRHGFRGGPKTHGQSDRHRAPGSIGATSTPGRVFKGMRMAGRMGGDRVTIQNLEVVRVDLDRNLLLVKGSVPGAKGGLVLVRDAVKG